MAEFNQEQLALLKDKLIEELGLQERDLACLKRMHINTIGDLLKMNKSEMILLDTLGKLSVEHIEERLFVYTVTSDERKPADRENEDSISSSPNWDPIREHISEDKDPLDESILELDIRSTTYYALRSAQLPTIRSIISETREEISAKDRRLGEYAVNEICEAIKKYASQNNIKNEIKDYPLFRQPKEDVFTNDDETKTKIPEAAEVKAVVYDPFRAPISDLNIKAKSYHALKSANISILLDILQNKKHYLENEYSTITPEILEDIDKAIRRLTSDHGCLSLALSFPFFVETIPSREKAVNLPNEAQVEEKNDDNKLEESEEHIDESININSYDEEKESSEWTDERLKEKYKEKYDLTKELLWEENRRNYFWYTTTEVCTMLSERYPNALRGKLYSIVDRILANASWVEISSDGMRFRWKEPYSYSPQQEEIKDTQTDSENAAFLPDSGMDSEVEKAETGDSCEYDNHSLEATDGDCENDADIDTDEAFAIEPPEESIINDEDKLSIMREINIRNLGLSLGASFRLKRVGLSSFGEVIDLTKEQLLYVCGNEALYREILENAEKQIRDVVDSDSVIGITLFASDEVTQSAENVNDEIGVENKTEQSSSEESIEEKEIETDTESSSRDDSVNATYESSENATESLNGETISIREAIKVLPLGYQRVIKCRLQGMKTQEIADKAGVTKQRISEVLRKGMYAVFHGTKSIKAIDRVTEDEDKELFERYNISLAEWTEHLHKPAYAYHYLKLRYRKGDKPLPGSGRQKSNNKPLGLTRTPDGIKGVVNRGRLEDLIDYYKILGVMDRDVVLYSDEEEYSKGIKKLCRMINREIKRKKYISDIRITDQEYTMLRGYLHYAIQMLNKTGIAPDDAMFATAVTNVAIKIYKDGNLWGNFFKEVQLKQSQNTQKNIGVKFYEILEKYDLVRGEAGEYFQNILMHCFVSDYYANSYFDFLFNFYRIDLERDLSRLDTETMRAFMDSICSDENEGRTYMLAQHIGQAMAANRRGATIRIRNHMKLLDKFFWDDTFEITTTHRLYNLLQKWAKSSKDVIGEMEAYSTGRRRGAKRFSQPYIRYMGAENSFMLVVPPQSIKRIESEEIYWNVLGGVNRKLDVELMESVIGYKVLESRCYIPFDSVLDSFQLELCTAEGLSIKKFSIRKQDVRFFDDDGYPINSNTIKTGEVTAVTRAGNIVRSSALYDSEEINGLLLSYFNFEFEDILHMPDGHVVIIGRPEITNSIAGKGRIEGAACYMDGRKYDLYGRVPYLVLRMKASRFAGTAITINSKKQHLSDIEYESFTIDDKTDDVGYYVDLNNYLDGRDDVYRIDVDIPGGSSPHWEFVYIKDFAVEFDEAPYVFEPRGTVMFPEHITIKEIEDFCEKEPGVNGYKFTIKEVSRTLDFVTSVGEHDVDISIPVPAFFIRNQNGEWDSNIPAPVWHADLPDVIDLAVPYHKVTLYMDDVFADGGDSGRELTYRRNIGDDHILCDISKFKSYLTGDDIARQLRMRFGEVDSNLFTIIIHSKVISLQILGDFDTNDITVNADISGKADYYIDIRKGDETIAEKLPLIDGTARYNHEIGNGIYEVEVFELVDDDSGFGGEDYYSIGVYDQEMMNPYDMTDRSFKIIQVEEKGNPLAVLPIRYNYYVLDLKKTDDNHVYNGMMLVRKSFFKGSEIASFPVSVWFDDLNKPNYVWISFIDETYGDRLDFLYDTRKQGILQEENELLRPMVCYRRYTFLNDEEYIYHIDFCDEHYKNEYESLAKSIVFLENNAQVVFKEKTIYNKEKARFEWKTSEAIRIEDTHLDPVYKMRLKKAKIDTLNDLSKMSFTEATKIRNVGFTVLKAARKEMKKYGLDFREED